MCRLELTRKPNAYCSTPWRRAMPQKEPREMSLKELMSGLGNAHPGSIARPPLEAEYERRKFVLQRIAVVIAGVGVVIAFFGVLVGAAHLSTIKQAPPAQVQAPAK